jgi:hypothetical protein
MQGFEKQIELTKIARNVMLEFKENHPNSKFEDYFHLRPNASYISIVTTHKNRLTRNRICRQLEHQVQYRKGVVQRCQERNLIRHINWRYANQSQAVMQQC